MEKCEKARKHQACLIPFNWGSDGAEWQVRINLSSMAAVWISVMEMGWGMQKDY